MFSYDGQLNISLNEQWLTGTFFLEKLCLRLISSTYVLNIMLNLDHYTESGRYMLYFLFFLTFCLEMINRKEA